MSREEAAAKAQFEAVTGKPWESANPRSAKLCREDSAAIAAAIDAHDLAHGVHRLTIDDATVERAAKSMAGVPADQPWPQRYTPSVDRWRELTRAALAAAVQEPTS